MRAEALIDFVERLIAGPAARQDVSSRAARRSSRSSRRSLPTPTCSSPRPGGAALRLHATRTAPVDVRELKRARRWLRVRRRLLQLLNEISTFSLRGVRVCVLDEADRHTRHTAPKEGGSEFTVRTRVGATVGVGRGGGGGAGMRACPLAYLLRVAPARVHVGPACVRARAVASPRARAV